MSAFDAGTLSATYAPLDWLPEDLYEPVITCGGGDVLSRTRAVLEWREALLRGSLPNPLPSAWPAGEHGRRFAELLASTQLLRFTRGEEEIVHAVLKDMLRLVDQSAVWHSQVFHDLFRELLEAEKVRQEREAQKRRRTDGRTDGFKNKAELRKEAVERANDKVGSMIAQAFNGAWQSRTAAWAAVEDLFGPLSNLLGLGWDLSRGVLRSTGWLAAEKLRALLERLPHLKKVIDALGRMSVPPDPKRKSVLEDIIGPLIRPVEVMERVKTPDVKVEMKGVERSDDIGRMLPSEAALLTHPVLKMVWHARRAERALLTYEAEGYDFQTILVERPSVGPEKKEKPAEEKGPMILCVDTSGSMSGAPETVAKAIALEALRVAHAEKRRLFVYLFSGPTDVTEHELSVSKEGIPRFLDFLAQSFHGGTDVEAPLRRALDRVGTEAWRQADILLASDGEFPSNPQLKQQVDDVRRWLETRVHGLLIASGSSPAMEELCSPLHPFSEWRALLGDYA